VLRAAVALERNALIEGLGFVRLEVKDLGRSLTFYRDALRFELDQEAEDPPQAFLRAGDLNVVLAEVRSARSHSGNGVRLSIEVTGVDAYHDALVARGVVPSAPVDDQSTRFFSVRDPDGYEWRFHQSLS
jgi:uncharacterized glyoxalase superfamily protein PhnB